MCSVGSTANMPTGKCPVIALVHLVYSKVTFEAKVGGYSSNEVATIHGTSSTLVSSSLRDSFEVLRAYFTYPVPRKVPVASVFFLSSSSLSVIGYPFSVGYSKGYHGLHSAGWRTLLSKSIAFKRTWSRWGSTVPHFYGPREGHSSTARETFDPAGAAFM